MSYNESLRLTDDEGEETGAEISVNDVLAMDEIRVHVIDEREDEIGLCLTRAEANRLANMLLAAAGAS